MAANRYDELQEPETPWNEAELQRARRSTCEVWRSEEDQLYLARCVEILEAMSQGNSQGEAIHNAVDAVAVVLDAAATNADVAALRVPEPRGAMAR